MDNKLDFFKNIKPLYTERLILRRINKSDLSDVFEYASDPRTSEYLLWSPHPNVAYTKAYLQRVDKLYKSGRFYDFAITLKDTGKMIGTVGFTSADAFNSSLEIGYVLNFKYHGRGIATEAVRRIIEFGFCELNFNRIEAKFMVENSKSRDLLRRLGFKAEGILREAVKKEGQFRSCEIYSLLKSDKNIK